MEVEFDTDIYCPLCGEEIMVTIEAEVELPRPPPHVSEPGSPGYDDPGDGGSCDIRTLTLPEGQKIMGEDLAARGFDVNALAAAAFEYACGVAEGGEE